MPRPQRCRRVCRSPQYAGFTPDGAADADAVVLTVDEYEAIRLVDLEGCTHEQCAARMQISRTTVTEICESAHRKLAQCLVQGRRLLIAGGSYRLCSGPAEAPCADGAACPRQVQTTPSHLQTRKGEPTMRIAATYENGMIFQHFGHTEQFKLYDIENNLVVNQVVLSTNGSGHGALAGLLQQLNVDVLICGGIGPGAQNALANVGIRLYAGVQGSADAAVAALLHGSLNAVGAATCDHHGHDHGAGHDCGSHSCGEHGCH